MQFSKFYILAFFSVFFFKNSSSAQISDYTQFLAPNAPKLELDKITTNNDFDQTGLAKEVIDHKIRKIINSSDFDFISELELPYNKEALNHLGKKHPKEILTFNETAFNKALKHIDRELEVFEYDGFYILLPNLDNRNTLNLFFTLRALTIIKHVYPEAYENLLTNKQLKNIQNHIAQYPNRKVPAFIESKFIFSFDDSPVYIAANISDIIFSKNLEINFDGWGYNKHIANQIISIDSKTILGETETGSKPLYQKSANENYLLYLRDGLVESIIHESIHTYIIRSSYIDEKAFFIKEMGFDTTDVNFSRDVEEAIVLNTVLRYYKKKGGFSDAVISYYENQLQIKKEVLVNFYNNKINLQRYYALKALSDPCTNPTFDDIYYLKILE